MRGVSISVCHSLSSNSLLCDVTLLYNSKSVISLSHERVFSQFLVGVVVPFVNDRSMYSIVATLCAIRAGDDGGR